MIPKYYENQICCQQYSSKKVRLNNPVLKLSNVVIKRVSHFNLLYLSWLQQ